MSSQDNLLLALSADKYPLKKSNSYFPISYFEIIKSRKYTEKYCYGSCS